ncbi:MAG: ATP-binding cassette domain-containing protein, partial [Acidobacteria bacterium]|nr:ATP-binding cassette domain-containing protein [Acidobacteriota bacterium]
ELTVTYPDATTPDGRLLVIDRMKLGIPEGKFITVIGPNGCGKTTLLLCLAGLRKPSGGTVSIGRLSPVHASCGYVFQNYRESLFPWLTVIDNISLPLRINGIGETESRQRAMDLLRRLKVSLPLDRYPYTLSGGQQQLTAILRSVIHEPNVLLLDEPFGSLDPPSRRELRDSLQDIWRTLGATTVLVTHDIDEAIYLADTVVVLTPRPAKVALSLDVTLVRPRRWNGLEDDLYGQVRAQLSAALSIDRTQ